MNIYLYCEPFLSSLYFTRKMASNQQEPDNGEAQRSDYNDKLVSVLKSMRENQELCDITIKVGSRSFLAHKTILAASSNYFRAMFSHGFKESSASEVNIDGDPKVFELLLEYAYTGQMKIVPKLAFGIVEMACYMQFKEISEYLCQFMKLDNFTSPSEKIDISSALKMYLLTHGRSDLAGVFNEVMRYLCDNIKELKETEDFLSGADRCFMDEFLEQENLACSEAEKDLEILVSTMYFTRFVFHWSGLDLCMVGFQI